MEIKEKKIISLAAANDLNVDQNTNRKKDTVDRPRRSLNRSGRQVQFLVDCSQSVAFSEKSPAATKVTSRVTKSSYFNHTESVAPPSSPIDELLNLFPPTPVLLMQSREGSKTPVKKIKKALKDAYNDVDSRLKHHNEPRGSQLSPNHGPGERAKGQSPEQDDLWSRSKPPSPQPGPKKPTLEIPQRRQPDPSSRQSDPSSRQSDPLSRQSSGVLRRPTTRLGRMDKRSALVAGHGAEQSGANKKSRLAGNKEEELGPMMSDLRSPNGTRISAVRGRQGSKGRNRKTVG